MKKNGLIQKYLIIEMIFIIILSTFSPLVIGYNIETKNEVTLENIIFNNYNEKNFLIKEHLRVDYLKKTDIDDDKIEDEKQSLTFPQSLQLNGYINSPWSMKCHDAHHTGRSPYSTADNNGVEIWRFECDWVEGGSVIDNDGTIYFGDFNQYLYALNPNGTMKWRSKVNSWIWSTPTISNMGTIYIGSFEGILYAFNPDGSRKWTFNAKDSITSSPAIAEDGTIYFGTMGFPEWGGCNIFAVNPDGTEKWCYQTGYKITSSPAIGDDGTIYIGSGDTYLYAMKPDGTMKWRFKTGDIVKSHPSIAEDGTIYFASFDGFLYSLYPNGTMKWKHGGSYGGSSSASIDRGGTIYTAGNNKLLAIYPNGTRKWSFDLGNRKIDHSSPAISVEGEIYIGVEIGNMAGGEIIAINSNGTEKWRMKIANNWIESSPSISSNGTVYIGSSSDNDGISYGYLHAFSGGETNQPPDIPTISGAISGKAGNIYNYTIVTTDPDKDAVSYYIDWDDGTEGFWTRMLPSGESYNVSHVWTENGNYVIRAKARDTYNLESDWATLQVSMPKNKVNINSLLELLFQRNPNLFHFLRYLLNTE